MTNDSKSFGSDLVGQRQNRIAKVEQIRELGIDPYPSKSDRTHYSNDIVENFNDGAEVVVAGRLMSWRNHSKIYFADLQDAQGRIQLYMKTDEMTAFDAANSNLGPENLELLDVGDMVEVIGSQTKTDRGVISVLVTEIKIICKAIRPLPEKWAGVKDKETRFRKRYLDTIMNPENLDVFKTSAKIVYAIREFMDARGFHEIKTPLIQPVYGGTNAKPFETHVNALGVDYYMAVAHELYLKKLIVAGFENVYNLYGYFRNEGIDRTHNPEFRMLETMSAFKNYEYNMELTEELYKYIGTKVFGSTVITLAGKEVDLAKPWERLMMIDAVKRYADIDFTEVDSLEDAHKILDDIGFEGDKPETVGQSMVVVFEEKVEEHLIEPVFIIGHPVEVSPLAKSMPDNPKFVERFEVFIGGIEQGDNWTELNDPQELYERFADQVRRGRGGDDEFHPMDIEFIEAMEYGMPPTTGLGPGIERLVMTFTGTEYIDEVLFFPMMRPSVVDANQKKIYDEELLIDPSLSSANTSLSSSEGSGEAKAISSASSSGVQDKTKKMVIVLNKQIEGWMVTNTVGHISAYLGRNIDNFASRDQFELNDDTNIAANSQYPIITLSAKAGQMITFLNKVRESDLVHLAYTQDMIDFNDDSELEEALAGQSSADLNIAGIGVFGDNDLIDSLTKKYSLWG